MASHDPEIGDRLHGSRSDHHIAILWSVHWPLMAGLLHLVQRGGAWAGPTNFVLFDVALYLPLESKGLNALTRDWYTLIIIFTRPDYCRRAWCSSRYGMWVCRNVDICPSLKMFRLCQIKTRIFQLRRRVCPPAAPRILTFCTESQDNISVFFNHSCDKF